MLLFTLCRRPTVISGETGAAAAVQIRIWGNKLRNLPLSQKIFLISQLKYFFSRFRAEPPPTQQAHHKKNGFNGEMGVVG